MIVGWIAIFFKMAFNAVVMRYIVRITMALLTQNFTPWGWESTNRRGVGGGRNLGGEGGEGAGVSVVGVAGVAGKGGDGGSAIPDVEEVEGVRDGDVDGGVLVVVGEGSVGINEDGDEGMAAMGKVVTHLPHHIRPSALQPRIYVWQLFLSFWREER